MSVANIKICDVFDEDNLCVVGSYLVGSHGLSFRFTFAVKSISFGRYPPISLTPFGRCPPISLTPFVDVLL